jgi:hypothetical protein
MLSIEASTRGGRRGLVMTQVRVDRGPRIKILSPRPRQPVKSSVTVQVQVDHAPFESGGAPMATVAYQPVALREVAPNVFEAVVELSKFKPPLSGEQLFTVTAQSSQGTKADAAVLFVVDHIGPTFAETSPPPGAVVGQVIEVRAVVQDPAGVLGSTVTAIIGHKGGDQAFTLMLKAKGPGVYAALFDTARLRTCGSPPAMGTLCNVFPNISFRAADQLGNETTVAYDLHVDNQGPIIELDPEPIRLLKYQAGGYMCSHAFRPNGNYTRPGSAPNDLCRVPQTFDLRAWAEDVGNPAYDQRGAPFAAIDAPTVAAYVQQDTSTPLVVDSDGDSWCDTINPKLEPTTRAPLAPNQVLKVRLAGVPMRGAPDFSPLPELPTGCLPKFETAPDAVCSVLAPSRDTIAIGHPDIIEGPYPSIWTLEPITEKSPFCLGAQFDTFANEIRSPGWICLAVAARDKVGNLGVSKPLRLWVDRATVPFSSAQSGCLGPPPNAPPPPSCVGTYTLASDAVTTTACKWRRFSFPNNRREAIVGTATMTEK